MTLVSPLRMPTVPFRLRRRRLPPLLPQPQHPPRLLPHLRLPLPLPVAPPTLVLPEPLPPHPHLSPASLLLPLLNNGSWRSCNGRSAATWRAPGLKRSASDRPDQHHCKVNLKKDDIARGLGCVRTTNHNPGTNRSQPQVAPSLLRMARRCTNQNRNPRDQACTLKTEERR